MLAWFAALGALGLGGVLREPAVLAALDPRRAAQALVHAPGGALVVLAAVFLAVTGGEALYADLGQFGRPAIQRAWMTVALPGLALNYLGQGALLLGEPAAIGEPFYRLAPEVARLPLVALATCATVIASQAVVTGVFAVARQAGQLGLLPPLRARHTSQANEHHVYVGLVNALVGGLAIVTVLAFGSSEALADAYGLAVAVAMIATSTLFAAALGLALAWPWPRVAALALVVVGLDLVFVTANLSKLASGGWLPAVLAGAALLVMAAWTRGNARVRPAETDEPLAHFARRAARGHTMVPRAAVCPTAPGQSTPNALLRLDRLFGLAFSTIVLVTVRVRSRPRVPSAERVAVRRLDERTARVEVSTGFMQGTDLPTLLGPALRSLGLDPGDVVYVVSRDRVVAPRRRGLRGALLGPLDALFVFLTRNAQRSVDRFGLPPRRTVELGSVRRLAPPEAARGS